MEQRSRAQRYQQLRQNIAVETETTVKSRDLSRYAKQMETYQTPTTQEFHFEKQEPVIGSRSRAAQEYLDEIQKESDAIDQIIKENEELMVEAKPVVNSRAQRFASMFLVDDEEDIVVTKPQQEVTFEELVEDVIAEAIEEEPTVVEEITFEESQEEAIEEVVEDEVAEEELLTVEETTFEDVQEETFEELVEDVIAEAIEEEPTVVEEIAVEEAADEWFETQPVEELPVVEEVEEDFDIDSYEEEVVIKDHFMEDILLEAKKYSVDKGQRAAIDTTATILSELTQTEQETVPFEDVVLEDTNETFDSNFAAEIEGLLSSDLHQEVEEEVEVEEVEELQANIEAIIDDNLTADFFEEEIVEEVVEEQEETVEEIVEEVLENTNNHSIISHEIERDDYMELTMKLDQERIFREEMMQKTKQMKLQLDEYETELNTVSNKVSHTNMVLNFVLILLIVALFSLLGFIAYWALVDRGLIGMAELEQVFETFTMFVGNWL